MKDYFLLALGNLRHRGIRSWLTILGIFIGIAAVVSLISLSAGLKTAISAQFGTLDADKLTVENVGNGFGPPGSTSVRKLTSHDERVIGSVSGVDEVITRLVRIARLEYRDEISFSYVANVPPEEKLSDIIQDSLNVDVEYGRFLRPGERGGVVIGNGIANLFEEEIIVGKSLNIQGKDYEVLGILEKGSSFTTNDVVLMATDDLKEALDIEDEIDIIIVQLENQNDAEEVANEIERKLRDDRNQEIGEEDFSVKTPKEALESVDTILGIVNVIVIGIAAISLLVGGLGIMNTMYTSVLERRREIGIMKSIGAQNKDILYIFLIESSLLGFVGGVIGALIGLGFALAASFIANSALGTTILTVQVSFPLLFSAVAFSLVVGIASGVLPAIQASKLNVVDALRK